MKVYLFWFSPCLLDWLHFGAVFTLSLVGLSVFLTAVPENMDRYE